MGEYNEPVDYRSAAGNLVEALADYLYTHYESQPALMRNDDPRATSIGDTEPWHTAGKRMREKWFTEANQLLAHFAAHFTT